MYHHHQYLQPSASSSTSSSYTSRMILLDCEDQYSFTRDSVSMNKATQYQLEQRRESIGEVVIPRKVSYSTSIMPRRTQSSVLQPSTSTQVKQKSRRKYYSLQYPLTQHEKNTLASFDKEVQWDPHIDAFEIIRAKITGITRSMQKFHVQELFQNDDLLADEKRLSVFPKTTTSSPLLTDTSRRSPAHHRRLSLVNQPETKLYQDHYVIQSQNFIPDFNDSENDISNIIFQDFDEEKFYLHNLLQQPKWKQEEKENLLTSPKLTALFLTTNNLIISRLNELSETVTGQIDGQFQLEWQKSFLKLVTNCINQSEALESLSTVLLQTEHRLRELLLISDNLNEQFQEREKKYEERLRECQEIAQQQLIMIDSLEELNADIDMKLETHREEIYRQETPMALDARQSTYQSEKYHRWNFQKSVAELLHMEEKHETIQKMRWEIGLFVGGGVGTGHIIHTFQDTLNGMDMMIAGTGATSTSPRDIYHQMNTFETNDEEQQNQTQCISPSVHHMKLYQHHYLLHLSNRDRQTRFALLPKCLWIPDAETNRCQFNNNKKSQCDTNFSFFRRKHHCRKCGLIICQRHSANRLPLFNPSKPYSTTGKWSRVCDICFYDLIMHK